MCSQLFKFSVFFVYSFVILFVVYEYEIERAREIEKERGYVYFVYKNIYHGCLITLYIPG